jgi:hypothetical protein
VTRGCTICQRAPAKKAICCGQRLCDEHAESCTAHDCPTQRALTSMSERDVKLWKAANAPEQTLTTAVIVAWNALPEIEFAWQGKKGGIRAHDVAPGLPDVLGYASDDARLCGAETKRNHKDGCGCDSCVAQRDFGARLTAAGGVYVGSVRSVQQAIDGVRMGLARVRAGERRTG